MKTPICDFVRDYIQKDVTRLHMPGHKGQMPGDITEIPGADCLYCSDGIIAQSQENASALFGSFKTVYSAEGASLAIRAMVYLTRLYAGRRPVIAAGRNAHKTFVTAAALLDADVRWLWPGEQEDCLSCKVSSEQLEQFLRENAVDAVYITSPDYLGNVADIASLATACHRHGSLLLVDNAHGSYLRFLEKSLHPMDLGADMCCDSAHKTLPVLTGGAYLHIAKDGLLAQQAENAMSLFASTSPSYLILASLDSCNRYLAQGYPQKLQSFLPLLQRLKEKLQTQGYALAGNEPMKLTIAPKGYGYTGYQLADYLAEHNMICEFADPDYVVMMLTPENGEEVLLMLEQVLTVLPAKQPIEEKMPAMAKPEAVMSMHTALMQKTQCLPLSQCLGKVLAAPTVSCPPAVPILVCGERVSESAIAVMEYYGIETLQVL